MYGNDIIIPNEQDSETNITISVTDKHKLYIVISVSSHQSHHLIIFFI
jgi:hypothetical protein